MVKINCEGVEFPLDERIDTLTSFFKELADLGEKGDIVLKLFKKEDVQRLLGALKVVDYKFKEVTKVNQSDASAYIGGELTKYFAALKRNSTIIQQMS